MDHDTSFTMEQAQTNNFGEFYFYSSNAKSFEKQSSSEVLDKYFSQVFVKEDTFYLIIGADSGLLIRYLFEKGLPKGARFLFIEQPQYIEHIKTHYSLQLASDNINICTVEHWLDTAHSMTLDAYLYQGNIQVGQALCAIDMHDTTYHEINTMVSAELDNAIAKTIASLGYHEFIERQFANICENQFPTYLIKDHFKGKSAIILAGGPSLDEHIEWVKLHQDKLLIIAVSRISRRLIQAGLTPHIVVCVDPYPVSFDVSRELLKLDKKTVFVHSISCHSGLVSQWHGKKLYLGERLPWSSPLNQDNAPNTGPTVTNAAYTMAVHLGVENILLIGVDLCNSRTGMTHASGSIEADVKGENLNFIGERVSTYEGYSTQTTIQYLLAAEALNQQAEYAKDVGVSTYNLSINAIALDNIEYVGTEQLSFDAEREDFFNQLDNAIPDFSQSEILSDISQVSEDIQHMLGQLNKIESLAKEALHCNKMLYQTNDKATDNFSYKLRMDEIEAKLEQDYQTLATFIKKFGIQYFVQCLQPSDSEYLEDTKLEEMGRVYYEAYIKSTESLTSLLLDTEKRIVSRLLEFEDTGSIEPFIKQWRQDDQPGRAIIWRENMKSRFQALNNEEKAQLDHLDALYEQLLTDSTHSEKEMKATLAPLDGVKQKINILFKQKRIDCMADLALGLERCQQKYEDAVSLCHLARAYFFILTEDFHSALAEFEYLTLEELSDGDLQQLASIALNLKMAALAESVFEMLAHRNIIYYPSFAKILQLNGKIPLAIDVYSKYLSFNSKDVQAWLNVAQLYEDTGNKESARMAYQVISELYPENDSVIKKLASLQA